MQDIVYSFIAWNLVIYVFIFALQSFKQVEINLKWLLLSTGLFLGYMLCNIFGSSIIPIGRIFEGLEWNWSAKILAIVFVLLVLGILMRSKIILSPKEAGFTLKQRSGSFVPALLATLLAMAFHAAIEFFVESDGPSLGLERLLFQATMPGLDEELMFRGIFLLAIYHAVKSKTFDLFQVPVGWAAFVAVLPFGLAHGIAYQDGNWHIQFYSIAVTGVIGFILLWIRERTGSLLLPILAHNAVNVSGSFF